MQGENGDIIMAEYIDKTAALSIREPPKSNRYYQTNNLDDAYEQGWDEALSYIEKTPTADVAPVVHGKWVTTSEEVFPGSSQFLCYSHKHEECGFQYVGLNGNEYNYCPKCGAKMDSELNK